MIDRCKNENNHAYGDYGGRGIKVCDRWALFENFIEDMGSSPSPDHSIDRYPDKNGDYEKSNCRWATFKEQANNRRSNRIIIFRGISMTLAEAVDLTGLKYHTVRMRLCRGWPIDAALTDPLMEAGTCRLGR
jgi:hypothetical protein